MENVIHLRRTNDDDPLGSYKDILHRLWIKENRSIPQIINHMKETYDFNANKRQYEHRFNKWGWRKNLSKKDKQKIQVTQELRRQKKGKEPAVSLSGRQILNLSRKLSRSASTLEGMSPYSPSGKTPDGVEFKSPRSDDVVENEVEDETDIPEIPDELRFISAQCALGSISRTDDFDDEALQVDEAEPGFPLHTFYNGSKGEDAAPFPPEYRPERGSVSGFDADLTTDSQAVEIESPSFNVYSPGKSSDGEATPDWASCIDEFQAIEELDQMQDHPVVSDVMEVDRIEAHTVPKDKGSVQHRVVDANEELDTNSKMVSNAHPIAFSQCNPYALCRAVQHRDSVRIRYLLDGGANVETVDENGMAPLHIATAKGDSSAVMQLVKYKANPRSKIKTATRLNKDNSHFDAPAGFEAIHLAAWRNDVELARMLIHSGAHVEAEDGNRETALIWAARAGSDDATKLLLENGASTKSVSARTQMNSLFVAVEEGHLNIVQLLLDAGMDANETHPAFGTPLHVACRAGNVDIVDMLMNFGAQIDTKAGPDTMTPLHYAAKHGHLAVVATLLEAGAKVSRVARGALTPLHLVCQYSGNPDVIRWLLHGHPDLLFSVTRENGYTPLHLAVLADNFDAVLALIEAEADVSPVSSPDLWTPLHLACQAGNLVLLALLANNEASVESRLLDGRMPLHIAAQQGQKDVVSFVLEAGGKVNGTCAQGRTPLHVLMGSDLSLSSDDTVSTAQTLVGAGGDVNRADAQGWTPLHMATAKAKKDGAMYLLSAGANIEARDRESRTPLLLAMHCKCLSMVHLLCHRADIHARDRTGRSALHLAVADSGLEARTEGSPDKTVTQLLGCWLELTDTADLINATDESGVTPLMLAAQRDLPCTLQCLLDNGANAFALDQSRRGALVYAAEHHSRAAMKVLLERDPRVRGADLDYILWVAVGASIHEARTEAEHSLGVSPGVSNSLVVWMELAPICRANGFIDRLVRRAQDGGYSGFARSLQDTLPDAFCSPQDLSLDDHLYRLV